jgi:hypothetical protein
LLNRPLLIGASVAIVGAFLVGRYTASAPAVHDETRATVASKAVVVAEKHAEAATKVVAVADVDTTTKVVTRWLPAVASKDGCPAVPAHVEQEATTERHASTTRTSEAHRASNELAKQETQVQQSVVTLHTVEARPSWSVSLMPGIQFAGARAVDLYGPLVLGVAIERRILGPVWLGAWGSTSGAAGLSLRGEF